MKIQFLLRNSIQWLLIKLIKLFAPILKTKIMLFSSFMAANNKKYLLKETEGLIYVLHTKDIAVSRRIFIGKGDEHLKAIKAIQYGLCK